MWITVGDIERIYTVAKSYVYKLANKHKWRRIRVDRTVGYWLADVDSVLRENADLRNDQREGKVLT